MSVVHSAAVGTSDWHAVFFQFIAQSFDRQDRIVQHGKLLPNPPNMHIHRPRCSVVVVAPHTIQQHIPCEHSAWIP